MDILNFTKNGKYDIPLEEIDNIYVWTQISEKQEVLMSSESYFKLMNHVFERDTEQVIQVLKQKLPSANRDLYRLSDFMTFTANQNKFMNGNNCFVYCNNIRLLVSLACFLAHTMNRYLPEECTMTDLVVDKVSEPEKVTKLLESDFLIAYSTKPIPEHKYRGLILDSFITKRSKPGYCTLVYNVHKDFLFGKDLIDPAFAELHNFIDISPMQSNFKTRREQGYKDLMKLWYSIMKQSDNLVYSKEEPKIRQRQVNSI